MVDGDLDPRFAPVAQALVDGFDQGREVGAAVAVVLDGTPVVNLWHGHADRRRHHPWQADTLVCMFSVTKAMTALAALLAVDRRLVELDDPVCDVWPEFRGNGKDDITLRHVLTHQSGLVGFHEPMDREVLYDWPRFIQALEAESPWWRPGTRHGYHARTFGFLLGEVIRRVTGRTPGRWFADEVAAALDLDFYIGVPQAELHRCADILPARIRAGADDGLRESAREMMRLYNDLSTPTGAAFQNPSMGAGYMNTDTYRLAEIPAANGHGTALAVAKMYDGIASLLSADVFAEATSTQSLGPDEVLRATTHFGLGLMLHHPETPIGLRSGTFGHAGAGGSVGFHDPQAKLSFCYAMNQMERGVITGGTSASNIAEAVYACL